MRVIEKKREIVPVRRAYESRRGKNHEEDAFPRARKKRKPITWKRRKGVEGILDAPDSIPQDVLDKTKCVVIFPSVLKFAIGIVGSYGRGVMTRRGGETFHGPCGPPAMMALEGGSAGLQLGGNAMDFVLLLMSGSFARDVLSSKQRLNRKYRYASIAR